MNDNILDDSYTDMPLIQPLSTNGDGTGVINAIGDYSLTPTRFYVQPALNQSFILSELEIQLSDIGQFKIDTYGNIAGGLTNGYDLLIKRNGVTMSQLNVTGPLKTNDDISHLTSRHIFIDWATIDNSFHVTYSHLDYGSKFKLEGNKLDTLEVTLNDNLAGLVDHYFIVRGALTGP